MTDLSKCFLENRKEAINILKRSESKVCDFDTDNLPSVLIEYDCEIKDAFVSKALLNENGNLMFYLYDYDEWITDTDSLSFTANNIYTEIDNMIEKND